MWELSFSYSLGNVRDCIWIKSLALMKNNPSCTFLFFGTTYPQSINLHPHKLSSHHSYRVKTLNDILQEVWKHFLSLDCPKPLLPKVARPTKRCSQTTLLLQEREPENQIALAPVRLISQKPPRGNYRLITYSCLLFIPWPDSQLV